MVQLPATESLWAGESQRTCDALFRTATSANAANKSPCEMWHCSPPSAVSLHFLKPCYCNVKKEKQVTGE